MRAAAALPRPRDVPARRTFGSAPRWSVVVLFAAAGLVIAPLASLAIIAFRGEPALSLGLAASVLPAALLETALLLAGVALLTGILGVGTAWLVTVHRFPGRDWLAWLLPLPLAVPTYITAYVYVAARTMFATQGASMVEVARTLGAGRFEMFRTVALPLARPALAIGLALALLEALNDIGASEYLGVRTLTVSVYTTWLNRGSLAGAAQIACLMLAIVVALIALERRGRRDRRYTVSTRRSRMVAPTPLPRGAGIVAALACALPVVAGFVLPAGFLLKETVRRGLVSQLDAALIGHLARTIGLALSATLGALVLGLVVTTASRFAQRALTAALTFVVGLGYAVPGTVLALGLLAPIIAVDNVLNRLWRLVAGEPLGLFLIGSGAALVIAYVVRFLPIATGSLSAGLSRVSASVEDAARCLGAKPRELVLRIQLPLLRPALASAALLVFIDCLKELPATLLLRPLNVETLATLVYGHATRGAFEDGALAALVIVAVGIFPVMRLSRGTDQTEAAVVARALDPSPGRTGGAAVLPVREKA